MNFLTVYFCKRKRRLVSERNREKHMTGVSSRTHKYPDRERRGRHIFVDERTPISKVSDVPVLG